jgi:hypothetical protein
MAALIACGVAWRLLRPGGLDADATRLAVTGLVYYLLLPGLVLSVLWGAPMGAESLRISAVAAGGVLASLVLGWAVLRAFRTGPRATGTLLLAGAFPNATYLGLPVLEATFGEWARRIAIQYDLFACTPLLLTVGILLAGHYGDGPRENPLLTLLKVPPLWAAAAAVALNAAGIAQPSWLVAFLESLGTGVPPLMLIALGMGLTWGAWSWGRLPGVALVLILQLAVMPALVWGLAGGIGLSGEVFRAVVVEAAMPTMILGVVLCDRYGLDTGLYAKAVTLTTAASLLVTPLWHGAGA